MMKSWPLGAATALASDVYLFLMLWCATIQSSGDPETRPGLPYRETAIVVVPLVFAALVLAFAAIYWGKDPTLKSEWAAAYFSLVSFTTFSYATSPQATTLLSLTVAAQVLSAVALLICALPLLVSRLTNLDSPTPVVKNGTPVTVNINPSATWPIKTAELRSTAQGPALFIELEPGLIADTDGKTDAPASEAD
jgi:hypothetical protein